MLTYDPPIDVIVLAQTLLDLTVWMRRSPNTDDGVELSECKACGALNSHTQDCFVPALKRWLES